MVVTLNTWFVLYWVWEKNAVMCNWFFVIIRCLEDNDFRSEKWIDKKFELFMEMFPFIQLCLFLFSNNFKHHFIELLQYVYIYIERIFLDWNIICFIMKISETGEKSYNKVISKHNYILSTLSYIFKRIWNQSLADK